MKKVFNVIAICAVAAVVFSSCAKPCHCTYYEDGKKVYVESDKSFKSYEKELCTDMSREKQTAESILVPGKEVTAEVKCK